MAEFSIRQASVAGAVCLAMFNLLRLALLHGGQSWGAILRGSRLWLSGTIGIVILCQTRFFLEEARFPNPAGVASPIPVYGPGIFLYAAFFVVAIIALVISTWRDLRSTSGG